MKLQKIDVHAMQRQVKHFARSNAPEIKLVAGITGVVISTVIFCRETLKAEKVKEVFDHDSSMIRNAQDRLKDQEEREHPLMMSFHEGQAVHEYTLEECHQEMKLSYRKAAFGFFKCYIVPTAIMVGSLGLIVSSHCDLRTANAALNAALASVVASYDQLRTNIRETYGPDVENKLVNGITKEEVTHTEIDENGEEVTKTETEEHWDGTKDRYTILICKYEDMNEYKANVWMADEFCFRLTTGGVIGELNRKAIEDRLCWNDILETFGHKKCADGYSIVFRKRKDGRDPILCDIHTIVDTTVGPDDVAPCRRKAYLLNFYIDESNTVQN